MKDILNKIKSPNDIKNLTTEELNELSEEIRKFLIESVSQTGGHLASNLGVVELTLSLFKEFDFNNDKIVWDVGHQTYVHKILTGRKEGFINLRKHNGISGFPKRNESKYDFFDTGHSSTSISSALGFARARDLKREKNNVVAVIGDGALTGGMALEALNDLGFRKTKMIIILNDNQMSISKNVGGLSSYLNKMRMKPNYNKFKEEVNNKLNVSSTGKRIAKKLSKIKDSIKQLVVPSMLFEDMGLKYLGPIDGHDINEVTKVLNYAKTIDGPVIIHVVTQKGHGYRPSERNPSKFHGIAPFDIKTGELLKKSDKPTYSDVFSDEICELAKNDDKIAAITAAMPDGTGLAKFARWFPERFYDVGIAEEHAVTFSAGLAAGGLKPVFAVYSSFLQRAFDQILHDVCIQQLHVVFAIDRAGLVGSDGETHQGIFDLSFLNCIPNMTIFAPKDGEELKLGLRFGLQDYNGPFAIRYPRGEVTDAFEDFETMPVVYGKAEMIHKGSEIALVAVGSMVETACEVRKILKEKGLDVTVVNERFIKPIDAGMIHKLSFDHKLIVTMEENVGLGGFGDTVCQYADDSQLDVKVLNIALPDDYVEHGNVSILKKEEGIDAAGVADRVLSFYTNI